jgi:hypothetical protein
MMIRYATLAAIFIGIPGIDVAHAATECDWTATRKRNNDEVVCYDAMGPKAKEWDVTNVVHLEKLEQCLLKIKRTHRVERAHCAEVTMEKKTKK